MKILFLANWKIRKCNSIPSDLQPADYIMQNEKFWFFKYFPKDINVDVLDISSNKYIENFERNIIHLHILQGIKALCKYKKYDIVISHGITSAIFIDFFKRLFHLHFKHIVFDIHSFNSASESGIKLKFVQYASKSIDGLIYHSSNQINYYKKYFPWLVKKSEFIHYGTNVEFLEKFVDKDIKQEEFIISIGYNLRDNETLIKAFLKANVKNLKLKIVGNVEEKLKINDQNIIYTGNMPIDKLNIEIQKAKFCILPLEEKNYSFGQMTLLQQLFFNKALISAKTTSVIDYVENEKNVLFYEAKNVDDLAQKIIYLNENNSFRKKLENNSKDVILNKCREECMADKIYKFIFGL